MIVYVSQKKNSPIKSKIDIFNYKFSVNLAQKHS